MIIGYDENTFSKKGKVYKVITIWEHNIKNKTIDMEGLLCS